MPDRQVKILKNVFLSTDENRLKLVDIQFSNHIEKIIARTSKEIGWKEINSPEKRTKVIQHLSKSEYSA
ncbi:MAG: hypothetical protein OEM46_12440, partial [Ignavibacteria bacterium]|nr:hypothetical protein [Ignavibacteria bacterium]